MRRESKTVGSGITAQTVHRDVFDLSDREDLLAVKTWFETLGARLNQPWGAHSELIARARELFAKIEAELAGCDNAARQTTYKERDTPEWYIKEIVKTARAVELAAEAGLAWEAANHAIRIGELLAELRFKEWDLDLLYGHKTRSKVIEGARSRRRQSAEVRRDKVNEYEAKGLSRSRAITLAAKKFGVHPATVRSDIYPKKKVV
jgi:hypothetical protein